MRTTKKSTLFKALLSIGSLGLLATGTAISTSMTSNHASTNTSNSMDDMMSTGAESKATTSSHYQLLGDGEFDANKTELDITQFKAGTQSGDLTLTINDNDFVHIADNNKLVWNNATDRPMNEVGLIVMGNDSTGETQATLEVDLMPVPLSNLSEVKVGMDLSDVAITLTAHIDWHGGKAADITFQDGCHLIMHSSYGTEETYGYVEYETQNYKYLGLEIGETFVIPGDAVVTNVDADWYDHADDSSKLAVSEAPKLNMEDVWKMYDDTKPITITPELDCQPSKDEITQAFTKWWDAIPIENVPFSPEKMMLGVHSNVEHTQGWYVTFTADDGSIYDINSSKKCKITLNPGKEKGYPCVDTVWSQEFNVGKFAYSGLGTLGAELIYYMGQLKGGWTVMGCDIQDVVDNGLGQLSWATLMCTRYYQDGFKVGSFALIQFTAEEMIDVIDVTPNLVNLQQYNSKVAIQSPKCAAWTFFHMWNTITNLGKWTITYNQTALNEEISTNKHWENILNITDWTELMRWIPNLNPVLTISGMQVDWYTCHWGNTPHTKGNTRASDFHYTIPTLVIPYARFNPDTYDNDYGFTAQYDYGNDTKGQDLDNDPSTIFTYVWDRRQDFGQYYAAMFWANGQQNYTFNFTNRLKVTKDQTGIYYSAVPDKAYETGSPIAMQLWTKIDSAYTGDIASNYWTNWTYK